jgi:hypothetical protein
MGNEISTNGMSKETLKLFLRIAGTVILVLVGLNGFLATKVLFGGTSSYDANADLIGLLREQVKTTNKLAASYERGVQVQEDTKAILESLSSDINTAVGRQVTKKDLYDVEKRIRETVKSEKGKGL